MVYIFCFNLQVPKASLGSDLTSATKHTINLSSHGYGSALAQVCNNTLWWYKAYSWSTTTSSKRLYAHSCSDLWQNHEECIMLRIITISLRKQAYSNILKNLPPKTKFSDKNSDIFHISAQNKDCGYSLEPPHLQSMFLSRNKTNNEYPCKPEFYNIKVGFKGVNII